MNYQEFIQNTSRKFASHKVECGDFDSHAEDFFLQVTDTPREKYFLNRFQPVTDMELSLLENPLERRLAGEPLQYIVGHAWFWNSKFEVGPGVLIPRKETEHLVEFLLSLESKSSYRVAELGAGSGNIGISVLQERPTWEWFAFEKNPVSGPYLKKNAESLLSSSSKYTIIENDFFTGVEKLGPLDLIVSNPPYVAELDRKTLSREVLHEPEQALFSGNDGLDHIESLCRLASLLLAPSGMLVCEIGSAQGKRSKELALCHGFGTVDVLKDMAGLDRVLVARNATRV